MRLAPAWRIAQVALGAVLFVWALGWLAPLQLRPLPYAVLSGLLLAGAMWVTESLVASIAGWRQGGAGREEENETSKGPSE